LPRPIDPYRFGVMNSMSKDIFFSKLTEFRCFGFFLICMSQVYADSNDSLNLLSNNDLSHFIVPEGNEVIGWYKVENKILKLRSDPKRKHSVLRTKKAFHNFRCSLEFQFIEGNIDSGIELRNSDQIQIGVSGSLKRDMTGSPYIPGLGYPRHAEGVETLLRQKNWNHMTIKCIGPRYIVTLAGREIVDYPSPKAIDKGPIGIQLHGKRDMKIDFRNIYIQEI